MTRTMSIGGSLRLDLAVTDDAGAAQNITGATLTIRAYDAPRGTLKLTGTAAVTDGPAGEAVASISAVQNTVTEFAVLYLVVTLTESNGSVTELVAEKLMVG